jgi:hypothetical protein
MQRNASLGSASIGSASPDVECLAANRLAMWQLQQELLAGERRQPSLPTNPEWTPFADPAVIN